MTEKETILRLKNYLENKINDCINQEAHLIAKDMSADIEKEKDICFECKCEVYKEILQMLN